MRPGNLLQLFAIITLFTLTIVQYNRAKTRTDDEIYRLRVQKSLMNRQSFAYEYGSDYKKDIRKRLEEERAKLGTVWTEMMFKCIAVIVLALFAVFHFIRYFYIEFEEGQEKLRLYQYDAFTWFFNYAFFAIVAFWFGWFSNDPLTGWIIYAFGVVWALVSLWYISTIVQAKKIKKLVTIRVFETLLGSFIFFQSLGLIITAYTALLMMLVRAWT